MRAKPLAAIVSVGLSKFGRRQGVYARELFAEAALEAFGRLKNFDPGKDIKAAFIGQMSESYEHQSHTAPISASWAGLLPALVPGFASRHGLPSVGFLPGLSML